MAYYKRFLEWQQRLQKKFTKTNIVYLTVDFKLHKGDKRKRPPRNERKRIKDACRSIIDAEKLLKAGALLYGEPLRMYTSKRVFFDSEYTSQYGVKKIVLI